MVYSPPAVDIGQLFPAVNRHEDSSKPVYGLGWERIDKQTVGLYHEPLHRGLVHYALDQICPKERLAAVKRKGGRWIPLKEPVEFFCIICNINRQIFVNDDSTLVIALGKIEKGLCPAITATEVAFIGKDEMKVHG